MNLKNVKEEKEKVICSVELDKAEWAEIIKKEKAKAAKNVSVPGFRKGKVPAAEAIKHVNVQQILMEAANKAIDETVKKLENEDKIKKIDKTVYPTPTVEIGEKFDENEFGFEVIYWICPKVTIDNYKKLNVKLEKVEITDKEVNQEIEAILKKEKMLTKKENGKIDKGDQATFDFTGSVGGKEFPGGKAEKFELEIGSNQFIPGFEDQMVGMTIGEEKDIKVKFPKDYHVSDLAGADAVFKVKIHDIQKVSTPELNEEIIKSLNLPDKDVKTPAQFKKFLKENMQKFFEQKSYETNLPLINKAIFDNAKYGNIPEVMVNDEMKEISRQFSARLDQMNVKLQDFLKMVNKTEEEIKKELLDQAKQNVVVYGALDYIIEKEKLSVDKKTIDERYEAIAKGYGKTTQEIKQLINEDVLKESLLHEEALLKVIEWNK